MNLQLMNCTAVELYSSSTVLIAQPSSLDIVELLWWADQDNTGTATKQLRENKRDRACTTRDKPTDIRYSRFAKI